MASMTRSSFEHHSQAPASCCAAQEDAHQPCELCSHLRNLQVIEEGVGRLELTRERMTKLNTGTHFTFACNTWPIFVCPQPCFEAFELSVNSEATAQCAGLDVVT